jgi:Transposase IS4
VRRRYCVGIVIRTVKRAVCCLRTHLEQAKFAGYFGLNSCYFRLELDRRTSQFEPTYLPAIARHLVTLSSVVNSCYRLIPDFPLLLYVWPLLRLPEGLYLVLPAWPALNTALKPIAISPLPEIPEINENDLPELPTYKPPLNLQFQASESLAIGLSALETFQKLLTPAIIDQIVVATNSYAENARNTQDLDREELQIHVRL